MSDVLDQLAGLGDTTPQPASDAVVRGDLARGRAALRRRRFRRGITGLGATAALAVVAVAAVSGQQSASTSGSDGLDLVAYDGAQLPGFTVSKVPEGFVLQGSDPHSLAIARPDDHSDVHDFRGKLVVMLRSTTMDETPAGKAVEVDGRPATIYKGDPVAAQLYFSDGRHEIVVQSASELGLTDAELVEFADSVVVTGSAEALAG